MTTRGTIITFYSFKGGVGRTFALASVGAQLKHWRLRVLLVDWDLEAPGLTTYAHITSKVAAPVGLVPMFRAFQGGELEWEEHVVCATVGAIEVDVIPAGEGVVDLGGAVQQLDWAALYRDQSLGAAIEAMAEAWRAAYDVVLVDSRTGFSDTAGICIVQLPDVVALLGTASKQSFDGLSDIADRIIKGRATYPSERAGVHLVPVLTRFEGRVEHERAREWMERFDHRLGERTDTWLSEQAPRASVLTALRVPHVPYWSFGEEVPSPSTPSTPDDVSWAFENLAALLEHGLEGAERLADDRDGYVKESRTRREPYPADVVLVALPDELRRARELAEPYGDRVIVAAATDADEIAKGRHVVMMIGDLNGHALDRAGSAVLRLWASRADLEETSLSVLKVGTATVPKSLQSQMVLDDLDRRLVLDFALVGNKANAEDALFPISLPRASTSEPLFSIDFFVVRPWAWGSTDGNERVDFFENSIVIRGVSIKKDQIQSSNSRTMEIDEGEFVYGCELKVSDPNSIVESLSVSFHSKNPYNLLRLAKYVSGLGLSEIDQQLVAAASR